MRGERRDQGSPQLGAHRQGRRSADKKTAQILNEAADEVEDEEDEHLYHTTGWTRELWLQSLGIQSVLPPPEEQKNVTTAIGAARAKNARDEMAST